MKIICVIKYLKNITFLAVFRKIFFHSIEESVHITYFNGIHLIYSFI